MITLSKKFFDRPVLRVAPELLGKVLRSHDAVGVITEVEAYDGPLDRACHASKGKTLRTKVMFGPAGHWYVYLCYGMHWMLNMVCEREGYPAAVLIRGCLSLPSLKANSSFETYRLCHGEGFFEEKLSRTITGGTPQDDTERISHFNGPGKLAKYFGIDRRFNGKPTTTESGLWIEDHGIVIPKNTMKRTPRIGVAYAGEWAKKPYRFVIDPVLVAGRR